MTGREALNYWNEIGGVRSKDAARDLDYRSQEYLPSKNFWTRSGPYWDCVVQDGGTFTPGTDWSLQFDKEKNITNRTAFRMATAGGELHIPHIEGGSDTAPFLAIIRIHANDHQTVKVAYEFTGSSGDVQIIVNGTRTEYAGPVSDYRNISLVPGTNIIKVVGNADVDAFYMRGLLFNDLHTRWIDPMASRNPFRGGVNPPDNQTTYGGTLEVAPDIPEVTP